MIRDGYHAVYTEDDKNNLVIRRHTKEEIKECKGIFARRRLKSRIVVVLLFILFWGLTRLATTERMWFILEGITMLMFIAGITFEITTFPGRRLAASPYYVELFISEKLPEETFYRRSTNGGFEVLYPVQAVDTTSRYSCLYYLSWNEYKSLEAGQVIKTNVRLKDLRK